MKDNRDMFYSDFNYGSTNFNNGIPNTFLANGNMMASGPNVMMPNNQIMPYNNYDNNIEARLDKLERQVREMQTKLSNIEAITTKDIEINSNMYMI